MKSTFLFPIILFSIFTISATKASIHASLNILNGSEPTSSPMAVGGISYDSSVTTLGGALTLKWVLPSEGDVIHFQLVCQCSGWVALGLGSGMGPATDMMIGRISSDGVATVGDFWSTSEETPNRDKDLGGFDDLFAISGIRQNDTTTVSFSRKMHTGDRYDQPISEGWNPILLAFQPSSWELKDHEENMAIGKINVVRGAAGSGSVAGGYTTARSSHAFIMVVSWFFVLTGGALLGRYGRDWPKFRSIYFKYHQNIQLGGYIAACVGVLIQFFFAPIHFATPYHGWLGLALMLAVSVQVVWAMMRPQGGPQVPIRRYWLLSHTIAGKIFPVVAWVTALSGLWYMRPSGFALFLIFIYIIMMIVFVAYAEYKKRASIPEAMSSDDADGVTSKGVDSTVAAAATTAAAAGVIGGDAMQSLEESSHEAVPSSDTSEVELEQVTL